MRCLINFPKIWTKCGKKQIWKTSYLDIFYVVSVFSATAFLLFFVLPKFCSSKVKGKPKNKNSGLWKTLEDPEHLRIHDFERSLINLSFSLTHSFQYIIIIYSILSTLIWVELSTVTDCLMFAYCVWVTLTILNLFSPFRTSSVLVVDNKNKRIKQNKNKFVYPSSDLTVVSDF